MPKSAAENHSAAAFHEGGRPPRGQARLVNPNELEPQSQVFLVGIDFVDPDDTIAINSTPR